MEIQSDSSNNGLKNHGDQKPIKLKSYILSLFNFGPSNEFKYNSEHGKRYFELINKIKRK